MNSFIETLNQCGENFLSFAWPMLWQASLLIAVLFAVDFLLRHRLRASIRYALWLVVLVKLCVPPTLALPTSPAWWLHKIPPAVATKPPAPYTVTYDSAPLPEISQVPLPAFVPPRPKLTHAAWSLMFSVSISAALLGWLLMRWWQIARQVRRAAASERLNLIADEAQQFIGIKFNLAVKLTTNTMSPAVCGLFRPAILIPQSLAENFSDEQLRAVLLHELFHLRRRDVWVNFLQALLQIFYWWHPLVWLANARIRRVREESVDDAVMLALRDEAETYAPTLLEVAKLALNRPLTSLGLVGILESRHALRQRIERLVNFSPPRKAGLTLVSLLAIIAFTAVAVPMGGAPSGMTDATLPSVSNHLNPTNSTVSSTNNISDLTNAIQSKGDAGRLVQDGKLLYEMGKFNEAEVKLNAALSLDSANAVAKYYLGLVQQARSGAMQKQTKLGRQIIVEKLDRIRLAKVSYGDSSAGMPLREVLHDLAQKFKKIDPDKQGINFLINSDADKLDALFAATTPGPAVDVGNVLIKFTLTDVRLADVLDAIVLVADKPIKYSIQDYGVVFSAKSPESSNLLFTRTFLVGTNIFPSRLMRVVGNGTETNLSGSAISVAARKFFSSLGVDLATPPGKSVFFNASRGKLFVKATEADLDIIERALLTLNSVAPQLHIKARFVEVPEKTFQDFVVPNLFTNIAGKSETNVWQELLTDEKFMAVLRALEAKPTTVTLAEPEVTTTSGRQTQMRATTKVDIFYDLVVTNIVTRPLEIGPVLDVVPYVLSDGYTITLTAIPSLTEFLGYTTPPTNAPEHVNDAGDHLPVVLPDVSIQQAVANVNLWDGQTVVFGKFKSHSLAGKPVVGAKPEVQEKELLVFITATIVGPDGNRVHSDDELPFAKNSFPVQPPQPAQPK